MKKLVSVLFALLLVGSFAFAQDEEPKAQVGSWSRFIFVPASSVDGGDNEAYTGPSWASGSRIGVGFSGTSEKAGFNLDLHSNGNNFGVGDQAKIWVSPIAMLKIQGGKVQEDTLRGKFDDSDTLNASKTLTGVVGKDDYFKRFYPNLGVVVSLTPAEGVFIGMALDAANSVPETLSVMTDDDDDAATPDVVETMLTGGTKTTYYGLLTEDMLKNIQIGAGYTIPNIGLARVQYIGGGDDSPKWIQAAFAYTAMEGVLVDAGIKFNTEADTAQNLVSVAGSYSKDALSALVRVQAGFGEDAAGDELMYKASTDLSYVVADPVSVGLEAAFQKRDDPQIITVLPYFKVASGKGSLKTGFGFESNTGGADDFTSWALPIVITVGF